ncbi:MAG: hypothetical protein ABWY96_03995 [Gaiellaceae bacterium]|jgi:hypothetical protein
MTPSPRPWYWSWRDWRLSIWAFLFWAALLWPGIVSTLESDELFAGELAAFLIAVWLLGSAVIAVAEHIADRHRKAHPSAPDEDAPPRSRAGTIVRETLPFVAVVLLAAIIVSAIASALPSRPATLETAVAEEWQGESYTVSLFTVGGGDPVTAEATEQADAVSCEEIDASVGGEPVHVCEIVHCDVGRVGFMSCPETASPACAALVGGSLVLVSRTWNAGSQSLRSEMVKAAGGRCPA